MRTGRSRRGPAEERLLERNRDFEEFYAANYGKITALVAAVLGDRHEADDVAQEAFARTLARWPRVSGYELPEAWVRQVALHLAIDSTRRLRRMLRNMPLLRAAAPPAGPEPGDSLPFTALGRAPPASSASQERGGGHGVPRRRGRCRRRR